MLEGDSLFLQLIIFGKWKASRTTNSTEVVGYDCLLLTANDNRSSAVTTLTERGLRKLLPKKRYYIFTRLVHRNVIPMGIPWETSHGMGQHTFVFPMRQ